MQNFFPPNFVENVLPGIAVISQPSSLIFCWPLTPIILMMSGFQEGQTYLCSFSGSIVNHGNSEFFHQFCRIHSTWSFCYISAFQPNILEILLTPIILMMSGSKKIKPIFAAYCEVLKIMEMLIFSLNFVEHMG